MNSIIVVKMWNSFFVSIWNGAGFADSYGYGEDTELKDDVPK